MKGLCWLLIVLGAAVAFIGGILHFLPWRPIAPLYGYWMVAVVLLLLAIALRLMEDRK